MTDRGVTTIDQALAELAKLRSTLEALRLMPETMPQNRVDLAMVKALRGLNFTEPETSPLSAYAAIAGDRYLTDDVAGFDQIGIAWTEGVWFHRAAVCVRVIGRKRNERGWLKTEATKLLDIPESAFTGSADFASTLFAMISCPAGFVSIEEGSALTPEPMTWPKPGYGYWWEDAYAALAAQLAKGPGGDYDDGWRKMVAEARAFREAAKPKFSGQMMWTAGCERKAEAVPMTSREAEACRLLDEGKFF